MKSEHFLNKRDSFSTFEDFISSAHNAIVIENIMEILAQKIVDPNSENLENAEKIENREKIEKEEEIEIDFRQINFILLKGSTAGGKSHILKAVLNSIKEQSPNSKVLLAGAKELIKFFAEQKKYSKKIQELENLDLLLIDDIHLLAEDKFTQEELKQLLDILDRKNSLVISSYSISFDMKNQSDLDKAIYLEQSLYSRLCSGLNFNISAPDIDVLMRYTHEECERKKLSFTKSMCLTLARFCYDIRQLQGLLKTIEIYKKANKSSFTEASLLVFLKDYEGKKEVTAEAVLNYTAQYFSLQVKDIKGKSRLSHIVRARQMSMYLCRKLLGYSYPRIAGFYGGKDHTTVMYACEKIEKDPILKELAQNLAKKILLESSLRNL